MIFRGKGGRRLLAQGRQIFKSALLSYSKILNNTYQEQVSRIQSFIYATFSFVICLTTYHYILFYAFVFGTLVRQVIRNMDVLSFLHARHVTSENGNVIKRACSMQQRIFLPPMRKTCIFHYIVQKLMKYHRHGK